MSDIIDKQGSYVLGVGRSLVEALGYILINIHTNTAESYDEDSIAMVIPDHLLFVIKVPFILGTSTLEQIVKAMKESEMENQTLQWDLIYYSQDIIAHIRQIQWRSAGIHTKVGRDYQRCHKHHEAQYSITIKLYATHIL